MKKFVMGILAHVDSGKTTLSESMLYCAGEIRKQGRVDHKNAFLDNREIERERGITIFSKQAVFKVGDNEFTLVDTPGHVDFSAETERTLNVLDYAVLVISGTDGVQNHTETLWKLLEDYKIPVFIFINKMDISPYSENVLMENLKKNLSDGCVDFSKGFDEGSFDELAMCDEEILNLVLEGKEISDEKIKNAIKKRKVFPCFFGAALKNEGTRELLDGLCRFFEQKDYPEQFGARVFKISTDEQGKRLTHMKITGGAVRVRDEISKDGNFPEKVNGIRIYSGEKFLVYDKVCAGTVCAVTGLENTNAGDGLGFEKNLHEVVLEPVLNYIVKLSEGEDVHKALTNLKKLEEEEPQLRVTWNERFSEINVSLMGEVQLEVLKRIIYERYGLSVNFGQGSISYKETIKTVSEGVGHFEPLRHYAEVHLLLEPLKTGSGVIFESKCSEDELDKNWQRLILTHLQEKTHLGVLTGSPITDIKITLMAGKAHKKHTEGGDFRQATYRAVRHGLMCAESVLLEPWYKFKIEVPTENIGRVMSDIQNMGGEIKSPENNGEMSVLEGLAPVIKMRDYHSEVTGFSRGRGKVLCMFSGYRPCVDSEKVIEEIGYDPESDIENTPDSVFCSHGTGFNVKWNEVENYMHIESCLKQEEEHIEEYRVREYINSIATDTELMRIFEKTYGPVKRNVHTAMERRKTSDELKKVRIKTPREKGDNYLLIDGYNIIFAWEDLKEQAKESLDLARNSLINIICNYQGFSDCKVILVFDAYKVKGNQGEVERIHNIDVVYTKEAETADMYIEKVTHELGKKHRVRVATSDNLEQLIILGSGAIRVSADEFLKEVKETENKIKEFLKNYEKSIDK